MSRLMNRFIHVARTVILISCFCSCEVAQAAHEESLEESCFQQQVIDQEPDEPEHAMALVLLQLQAVSFSNRTSNRSFVEVENKSDLESKSELVNAMEKTAESANPIMDDVMAAFKAFSTEGVALDAGKGDKFPSGYDDHIPPYSTHFEGIQRLRPNKDGNFIALTGYSSSAGHLMILQLPDASSGPGSLISKSTATRPSKDKVAAVEVVSTNFTHAGGPAVFGDVLAVPVEMACGALDRVLGKCKKGSKVYFYDVSKPLAPKKLEYSIDRPLYPTGAVGLTQLIDGSFLLVAGRADSSILDFYTSPPGSLLNSMVEWNFIGTWSKTEMLVAAGVSNVYGSYQNLNLIVQKDGRIFLVGSTRAPMMIGHDWFDIFSVRLEGKGRATITKQASKQMKCHGCDFYAGAGIYIEDPKKLLAYSTAWNPSWTSGQIRINEFHDSQKN
eukprot:TRINITY_DN49019_c0_g1_i1.p1 TRINITY_DN49019_c0_g1~~TRINITY_DN49019_c0_g1_i1.p1  ORF type:complete len:443 (+),score=64.72 TRINITY_DN49019_c0_g1_i1:90-1418(+)